jgi:hypothetical protein
MSIDELVALVRARIGRLDDSTGTELRPQSSVATEVAAYGTEAADITLAFDLTTYEKQPA